jgi:hypothetical protein
MSDIDRIIERERDAAVDALVDGPDWTITDADYPPGFVYDRKSWHSDMGSCIGGDQDADDYIRNQLILAFSSMPWSTYPASDRSKIINTQCMSMYMMNIGGQVLENAIKNGLTLEKLGELSV